MKEFKSSAPRSILRLSAVGQALGGNMKQSFPFLLLLTIGVAQIDGQSDYTPKPGSSERQAICDAARAFVLRKYATATPPQPIVFKVEYLRVQDGYANLEAIPLLKDGSYISTKYIPDIGFNFCLKKSGNIWQVVVDLSRSDVPDTAELQTIRARFPKDFPISLLSPTWRDLINKL